MATKIWFRKTRHNTVNFKVDLDRNGYAYTSSMNFRENTAKDKEEYPLVFTDYDDLYEFLEKNDVAIPEEIEIDDRSIDTFYNFLDKWYADLDEKMRYDWWNHDTPTLRRFSVNKDNHKNDWGLCMLCFYGPIVESHGFDYYFEGITPEEAKFLAKGHEGTAFAKEVTASLSDLEFDEAKREVMEFEDEIQAVIDEQAEEILVSVDLEGDYGLDCGFLNIYTTEEPYEDLKRFLSHNGESKWLDIRLPWRGQSITKKRKVFNECAKIVKEKLGYELYCKTILD